MEQQLLQITQLLQSLHQKVDDLTKENKELRLLITPQVTVAAPKRTVAHSEREQCTGLTAKGTQCKNKCVDNGKCKMHSNQDTAQIQPKQKKQKKTKPKPPVHNHAPGEEPEVFCQLCESHGDILDPELPDREFEVMRSPTPHPTASPGPPVPDDAFLNVVKKQLISWADELDDDDDFFEN